MDIEDAGELLEDVLSNKNNSKQQKQNKFIKKSKKQKQNKNEEEKSFSSHKKRIFIKTFGCSHNASDSEYMIGILANEGYEIVDNLEDSDLTIINSCTVKSPSQAAFLNTVIKSKEHNKHVVVGGCVPQAERNLKGLENCSIVGVSQIDKIDYIVKNTFKNKKK